MAHKLPQQVRIIGGQWKRTRLTVVDLPGLRPTPDRVRETLFNWLGQNLQGWRCLDLFGGTGALGLEAASRGAAEVLINEKELLAQRQIVSIASKLQARQIEVSQQDALSLLKYLQQQSKKFDLIFLDPPFNGGWLEKVIPLLPLILAERGCVYVEAEAPIDILLASLQRSLFTIQRQDKAGAVYYYLLSSLGLSLDKESFDH